MGNGFSSWDGGLKIGGIQFLIDLKEWLSVSIIFFYQLIVLFCFCTWRRLLLDHTPQNTN